MSRLDMYRIGSLGSALPTLSGVSTSNTTNNDNHDTHRQLPECSYLRRFMAAVFAG